MLTEGPGLTAYDPGERLYLLPPAVLLSVGCLGLYAAFKLVPSAARSTRLMLLGASVFALAPLSLYVALEALFFLGDLVFRHTGF